MGNINTLKIRCGSESDSMERLEALCNKEAKKLCESLKEPAEVVFWTADFPSELICVGKFNKDENGKIRYQLDFSESTL